jgi:hypothetical protein
VSAAGLVLAAIDELYRCAVEAPETVDEAWLAVWLEDTGSLLEPPVDGVLAKQLRTAARRGARLARHWSQRDPGRLPDWRNGVDEALGSAGWRPALEVARRWLDLEPSPEAFREVKERFRAVHFQPWMEGISFEEYLEGR